MAHLCSRVLSCLLYTFGCWIWINSNIYLVSFVCRSSNLYHETHLSTPRNICFLALKSDTVLRLISTFCNTCWRVSAAVGTLTDGRGDASHRAWPGNVPGHRCCLGCSCCLSCRCLLLHLPVALTQVKHLAGDKTNAKIWWQDNEWTLKHFTFYLYYKVKR